MKALPASEAATGVSLIAVDEKVSERQDMGEARGVFETSKELTLDWGVAIVVSLRMRSKGSTVNNPIPSGSCSLSSSVTALPPLEFVASGEGGVTVGGIDVVSETALSS